MPRECPGCGATATPEARFCRRCGAPFRIGGGHDTDSPISPMAQTVPLADQGRTTDGLLTEESQQLATGTSRIRRTEMEDMLRRISREHGGDGRSESHPLAQGDGSSPESVPITSTLQTPSTSAPSHKTSSNRAATTTARAPRRWHRWQGAAIILLCMTLAIGLVSFISYRRSSATGTGDTPTAPASEEKQPDASAEPVPQPEQAAAATTAPPDTKAIPEPSRARGTEAAARPASETSLAATTTPASSPETRQTTTTAAPPPALSASDHYRRGVQLWEGDRRGALEAFRAAAAGGIPDAYYYLGSEYYSEGRDPKTLSEGELRAALNYFLRATSGPHSAQASRAAKTLGKEYERRKKHSRP